MQNKFLDIIPKAIAVLTSLLIFLGIIGSVVYYRAFLINILDYITLGEAITLFLSRFSSFVLATLFGVVLSQFLFFPKGKKDVENIDKPSGEGKQLTFWQRAYAASIMIPLFLISFMGFSPLVWWTIPVSLAVRLYVLIYVIKKLTPVFGSRNFDLRILDFIRIAGMSIIVIATIAMTEAFFVFKRYTGKEVVLHFASGEVKKSDSATLYLGKSLSYYYLYDKVNEKAIVIKADGINRIEFEKSRK